MLDGAQHGDQAGLAEREHVGETILTELRSHPKTIERLERRCAQLLAERRTLKAQLRHAVHELAR